MSALSDPEDPFPTDRLEHDTIPAPDPQVEAIAARVVELLRPVFEAIGHDVDDLREIVKATDKGVGACLAQLGQLDEALRAQGQSLAETVVQLSNVKSTLGHLADGLVTLEGTVQTYHEHNIAQASVTGRRLSALDELLTQQGATVEDLAAWKRRFLGEDNGSLTDAAANAETGGQ